jgi:NAD(P)-dependent dehydrogenase (short-subunit alcohol dehydrogenase family)
METRAEIRVAAITGGAKGIGRGCARVFAASGMQVVILDKDVAAAAAAAEAVSRESGRCAWMECDVSRHASVRQVFHDLAGRFHRLDVLINNAGYHISKSVEQTSEEEWDFIIATNLKSVFLCSKYAIPLLRKTRGAIVNMSSMVGLVGQTNAGAYSASKGGIIAKTKGMALDLAPDGIRVNCLCPGWVETPLVEDWFSQQADPGEARRRIFGLHPLGRISTPEEIGHAALFLAAGESSSITGVALPVDGAVTLGY